MVGVVPKLTSPSESASNWGVEVGVNAKAPPAVLGKSFKTIAVAVSGTPTSNLRIVIHRAVEERRGDLVRVGRGEVGHR